MTLLLRVFSICTFCTLFLTLSLHTQAQHERLIDITKGMAAEYATAIGLEIEKVEQFMDIYVKEALAVEDIIVNADPEVAMIGQIQVLESERINQVKSLVNETQFELYRYVLQQEAQQSVSRFDSLEIHMGNETFRTQTADYYDENVVPYLIYYHQTYFKPALRQKHIWKINQARQAIYQYDYLKEAIKDDRTLGNDMADAIADLDRSISSLKKIRKRYRDELDYISVALGPIERQWTEDYIKIVQQHFPDEIYERIKKYRYSMNAYGMDYLIGELSMILFDIWNPRTYIDSRETLSKLFRENLR